MMFSIVVPLYNKASSVCGTITSVLSQTCAEFEVIVVDDGSTDGGADLVRSFNDSRVRLIRKENGGVCSARNLGISEAVFDYVAFLDADDLWDKDYLLEQKKLIEEFPEAYMWGVNFAEMSHGQIVRELSTGLPAGFRGVVDDYFGLASEKGRVSDLFCSSSVVIRKSAFERAGMFDENLKYSEDIDMWFRIIANYPVAFYDKYLSFYMFDAENRAMNRSFSFKVFMPYYCDKYSSYKGNEPFYSYVQRWCAVKIKESYFRNPDQRKDALDASRRLDYTVLPHKYKYLFNLPFFWGWMLWRITETMHKLK